MGRGRADRARRNAGRARRCQTLLPRPVGPFNDAASTWLRPELTDHFILSVDIADPERVEKMEVILDDCGAVDVDEQVEARASDSAMAASLGHLDRRVEKARSLQRLSDRSVAGESSTRSRKA